LGCRRRESREIKKAYRVTRRSPTRTKAAAEEVHSVGAYDVLSDEKKRASYDKAREMGPGGFGGVPGAGAAGGGFGGFGGQGPGGVRFETADVDLGDLLGGMFGGGGRGRGRAQRRGADLETEVTLSFEDAMAGVTLPVTLTGPAPCTTCHGSGAAPGTQPVPCANCGGSGQVAVNQGFFSMAQTCPSCQGSGRLIQSPCATCGGAGAQRRKRTIQVKIAPGVKDGARIRLAGKGESAGSGGTAGDLFVRVHVQPHRVFSRRGDDLTVDLPVTFPEAALGRRPGADDERCGHPEGAGGNAYRQTFRIKGKGAPRKTGHGDLLATVVVDVPTKLSREQKDLVERLSEATEGSPRGSLGVT
jgi:molecular chaperone DnaJ